MGEELWHPETKKSLYRMARKANFKILNSLGVTQRVWQPDRLTDRQTDSLIALCRASMRCAANKTRRSSTANRWALCLQSTNHSISTLVDDP